MYSLKSNHSPLIAIIEDHPNFIAATTTCSYIATAVPETESEITHLGLGPRTETPGFVRPPSRKHPGSIIHFGI